MFGNLIYFLVVREAFVGFKVEVLGFVIVVSWFRL